MFKTRMFRTRMFKTLSIALALACVGGAPQAAEIAGVKLSDSARVGNADLLLNGAGVRTRIVVKVYVGALYLTEKKTIAAEAIALKGAKRISLHMLRDLSSEQLSGALDEGLKKNLSAAEQERLQPQLDDLRATMAAVGAVKEKSLLTIDYLPAEGVTRLTLDGAQKGKPIAGEDFYRALMKIWLGDKPVDADLKSGMLGQG
jgi:hypothetical protein